MIRAGELNKSITFQTQSSEQDSYGAPVETWVDTTTTWAGIKTTGSREFYAALKQNAETTAVFKIRYRNDLDTAKRIKYGNRYFDILGIADPEERHEELLISGREVV